MTCRVCGERALRPVIDLGPMPLVNNLLRDPDEDVPRWPLEVVRCPACALGQIRTAPPPDRMFREYTYFSSQSRTMVAHARTLVRRHVTRGDRVVEVASNDGYLLAPAIERGARVLGVEPAENVAAEARRRGVPTHVAYFDRRTARDLRSSFGPADVIFANNVLAHVPDPHEIAAGLAILLADDGVAHLEMPAFERLVADRAFDTIYHEHASYFTVTALCALFRAHGLRVTDVHDVEIHGGSLHVTVRRHGDEETADARCRRERDAGLLEDRFYADFPARVQTLRAELRDVLDRFEDVVAYGAAAKGVVLLNAFGLGRDRIRWVADVSPHKQGRFVPGTGQPIVTPAALLDERPEACLLLPWNLAGEIVAANQAYTASGGRFVVAVPDVRTVGSSPAGAACV